MYSNSKVLMFSLTPAALSAFILASLMALFFASLGLMSPEINAVPLLPLILIIFCANKILAQKNVLQAYATLAPLIKGIIFTSDSYWKNYAKDLGLQVIEPTGQMLNPHGTPYLFEMYTKVFAISDSYFAGYSNADILFSEDFVTTLCSIKQAIEHNKIRERILLVGKRLNHQLEENHIITTETTATLLSKTLLKWAKATDFFFPNGKVNF